MCDFEDWPIISKYTRQQAVEDGLLVQMLIWEGKPVMATTQLKDHFSYSELYMIWFEFRAWKEKVEPTLPEEDRLFKTQKKDRIIWVIEDTDSVTLMYPEDY